MPQTVKIESQGPVVMVDDQEDEIFVALNCYKRAGLPNLFVTLRSGEQLLAHLEQVRAGKLPMPALVLLDINMAGMSGFEVLGAVRRIDQFQRVPPIMMLTNSDSQKDIDRSFELGADGFKTKPGRPKEYIGFFTSLRA